jgi:hypothetical protein
MLCKMLFASNIRLSLVTFVANEHKMRRKCRKFNKLKVSSKTAGCCCEKQQNAAQRCCYLEVCSETFRQRWRLQYRVKHTPPSPSVV